MYKTVYIFLLSNSKFINKYIADLNFINNTFNASKLVFYFKLYIRYIKVALNYTI